MNAANVAAEILVEGHVQGVGYRDYARRRASLLGLAGWVMNLRDGRVRLRAEGPRAVIEDLVRALEKGPPLSRVLRVEVRWLPATGRFADFAVRFAEFEP
ncbi:MAG TPA: acylphosphatase [Methylomirabilota bacterium]|nr:acylphosphatase [Methylomirabilota bacterium]